MLHVGSRKKQRTVPDPDAELQKMLAEEVRCNCKLLPHQFVAVRSSAGVTKDFPLSNNVLCKSDLHVLLVTTRGIILADTMGLGKTVIGVAIAIAIVIIVAMTAIITIIAAIRS